MKIGLIKESKIPVDKRAALTPEQSAWIQKNFTGVQIVVQHADERCFTDSEYEREGVQVVNDISDCDALIGIKEVPVNDLIPGKCYLFFSHTKKKQPHNQKLLHAILEEKITLVDFECLEHEDGQRIIGFGFFAGIVGAHNGMMVYGKRTNSFNLERVFRQRNFKQLIHTYFGLKVPNVKIAVTGSGRVAHGVSEIMNLMGVIEVEKEEYVSREFSYPVYLHLKGSDLYEHKHSKTYSREHFHLFPFEYQCKFYQYLQHTDILMNGVYWDANVPRLFNKEDVLKDGFRIQVIADISDDIYGSIPINYGDKTIEDPVYGVDRTTLAETAPYLPGSIDIMAVCNLPNELPRDASQYFGEQLIKYVLPDLISGNSAIIDRATIVKKGKLTEHFQYLQEYAMGNDTAL
ncbi:MAG: NAD(P)-dependent oxidoreductase [Chitinophagaceae bacterium]